MPGKIKKIKTLLHNKTKLRSALGQILYDEKSDELLKKYGTKALPVIKFSELFSLYPDFDSNTPIHITSDFAGGSSPLNDYYVLCILLRALKAKSYFEIGTWVGLSAKNIANNTCPDTAIYTLDIPYDHVDLKVYNIPEQIFGYHSRNIPNVHHLKGDSKLFDYTSYLNKIDMVFVDGNHSIEYVANDTRKALGLLRNESSVIVWHDYLDSGGINRDVICGILEGTPVEDHKHLFHLHQSNTALYSKSFNFHPKPIGKWEMPEYSFDVEIKRKEN
jgi:predicted O-methyltransferase YrrM